MSALEAATPLPPFQKAISRSCVTSLRENSLLIGCTLLYVCLVNLTAAIHGAPYTTFHLLGNVYRTFAAICIAALAIAFILWILKVTVLQGNSVRSAGFWRRVPTEFMSPERFLLALPVLLLWPLFVNTFSLAKSLITLIQPFYLDQALVQLDRALHGGWDPWVLLQPLLGHPLVTYSFDKFYALWFFVLYLGLLLQAFAVRDRRVRMQFLLSFTLAWPLLGNVGATLLSSAGPCYYALIGLGDLFAPLTAYLHDAAAPANLSLFGFQLPLELIALRAQDFLWSKYQEGQFVLGSGISAAPSMHVATTWLIARMCQARGSRMAPWAWAFVAIILVGSVHLGWHYAVDGYLAIAGAWMIWRVVGWLLNRPAVQRFLWGEAQIAR